MYILSNKNELTRIGTNKVFGDFSIDNSVIKFEGEHNSIIFQKGASLTNSKIVFQGYNSVLYLESKNFSISSLIGTDCLIYIKQNNRTVFQCQINIAESGTIFLGNSNMIARNVKIWNSDFHPIYDKDSFTRVNLSKNVFIGDHVWLCEEVSILKNSIINSGAIVGYRSTVFGTALKPDSIYGGTPARLIKSNIFWDFHNLRKKSSPSPSKVDNFQHYDFKDISNRICGLTSKQRLDFLSKL